MGNVKSFCCRDSASDIDDREERSRILQNDACNTPGSETNNHSNTSMLSQQDSISYRSTNNYGSNSKTLEQTALDRIYQKMAANVLDVAPGESMVIQTAEFIERQRAYQAKLNQIKTPLPLKLSKAPQIEKVNNSLDHTNISQQINLEYDPILIEDARLISEISKKSSQAIKSFKVNFTEQIITQFKP